MSAFYLMSNSEGIITAIYIENIVSNLAFVNVIAHFWPIPTGEYKEFNTQQLWMTVTNILLSILFWNITMVASPGALRYIDPSWDNESPNGKLYPSLFYASGLAQRRNY